jgi:hypothetical protein
LRCVYGQECVHLPRGSAIAEPRSMFRELDVRIGDGWCSSTRSRPLTLARAVPPRGRHRPVGQRRSRPTSGMAASAQMISARSWWGRTRFWCRGGRESTESCAAAAMVSAVRADGIGARVRAVSLWNLPLPDTGPETLRISEKDVPMIHDVERVAGARLDNAVAECPHGAPPEDRHELPAGRGRRRGRCPS